MDNLLNKEIPESVLKALKAPLPAEAVGQHPTQSYLSTIKAIYVVERFNDVFGLGGWKIENTVVEKVAITKFNKKTQKEYVVDMVVVKAVFTCPNYGIYIESFGGNDNDDLGDAYKGACTDALTKVGSYLYVGMDVYKGLATPHEEGEKKAYVPNKTYKTSSAKLASDKQVAFIKKLVNEKNVAMPTAEWFKDLNMETAKAKIDNLLALRSPDTSNFEPNDEVNYQE